MSRNKIPEFFHAEIRRLVELALEDAWQELKNDKLADAQSVRARLRTTIVALAAIGETDSTKLKHFALDAARTTYRPQSAAKTLSAGRSKHNEACLWRPYLVSSESQRPSITSQNRPVRP
jgi:hypothetical protein